jgi:class 3 adenylate cyclase
MYYLPRSPLYLMCAYDVSLESRIGCFRAEEVIKKIKDAVHGEISFCGTQNSYCVGIVDMVSSTTIISYLEHSKMCNYYRIYLNFMTEIAKEFGAMITKNIGDSLLYYFPDTCDAEDKDSIHVALECSLAMIESREHVNRLLGEYGLPQVSYRVSSDYGRLSIAKSLSSTCEDIFGPTVNICSKINSMAMPNTAIVGGDLYQIARQFKDYTFHPLIGFSSGTRFDYPVYSLYRK